MRERDMESGSLGSEQELGSFESVSELGASGAEGGFSLPNGSTREPQEFSNTSSEFFPEKREGASSKDTGKKEKKSKVAKLIAATATIGTAVVVTVTAFVAKPKPPTPLEPVICGYTAEYYKNDSLSYEDYVPPSYEVAFSFELGDATPESVTVRGASVDYRYNPFGFWEEPDTVELTIPKEELILDEGSKTVTAKYRVQDAHRPYMLTATLNYTVTENDKTHTGSVSSEPYLAGLSYLYLRETERVNTVDIELLGDTAKITVEIKDFIQGAFEFRVSQLVAYINNETIYFGADGAPSLPTVKDGCLTFEFTVPVPSADSLSVDIDIIGDNYLNGEAMRLESHGRANGYMVLGTAYSLAQPTYDISSPNMSANGLTVSGIKYQNALGEYVDSIDKVLPYERVSMVIVLAGTANADGVISANVTVNEEKIWDLDLQYASEVNVYANDTEAYLEIFFTMPSENITAEDIIIDGIEFGAL